MLSDKLILSEGRVDTLITAGLSFGSSISESTSGVKSLNSVIMSVSDDPVTSFIHLNGSYGKTRYHF